MREVKCEVRPINAAIRENVFGHGGGVYCHEQDGSVSRVNQAKTVSGVLLVRRLNDGVWVEPVRIVKEW